jgi:hypothetical protein
MHSDIYNTIFVIFAYTYKYILRMVTSGVLRRVALVRTDVSEELSASLIRVN